MDEVSRLAFKVLDEIRAECRTKRERGLVDAAWLASAIRILPDTRIAAHDARHFLARAVAGGSDE